MESDFWVSPRPVCIVECNGKQLSESDFNFDTSFGTGTNLTTKILVSQTLHHFNAGQFAAKSRKMPKLWILCMKIWVVLFLPFISSIVLIGFDLFFY